MKFIIELVIFAAAIAVLARLREYRLATALAAIYIINRILMAVWSEGEQTSSRAAGARRREDEM